MKDIIYKICIKLNYSDLKILLDAIQYYSISSTFINSGSEIESCNDIFYKILKGLQCCPKEMQNNS